MGTYGVTHVKKDNTIITLSDSYDGYIQGGMGQANLLCLKYLPIEVLHRLFDEYTASTKVPVKKAKKFREELPDGPEPNLSQREIQEAVYRVQQDTADGDAVAWISAVLADSIRTSMTGFAPLLYLNINPHYGRDYDYCDYLIDLDEQQFVYEKFKIPFDKIRKASEAQLDALCSELTSLLPEELQEDAEELFYQDYSAKAQARFTTIVDAYFQIDDAAIAAYRAKEEQEYQQRYAQRQSCHAAEMEGDDNLDDDAADRASYCCGYSVHSTELDAPTLRAVVTLLQRLKSELPQCAFLSSHSEWGLNEDYASGGFRTFSPLNKKDERIHALFVETLKHRFKLGFNIFSTSGRWSSDVKPSGNESPFNLFTQEVAPGPQQAMFSLAEIREFEEQEDIFRELHPYLSFHADYREVRELILAPDATIGSPIMWVYSALLNQDRELFAKVYPLAKGVIGQIGKEKENQVYRKYLQSLVDAAVITATVEQFRRELGAPTVLHTACSGPAADEAFVDYLHTTTFFDDVSGQMNNLEKSQYLARSAQPAA